MIKQMTKKKTDYQKTIIDYIQVGEKRYNGHTVDEEMKGIGEEYIKTIINASLTHLYTSICER